MIMEEERAVAGASQSLTVKQRRANMLCYAAIICLGYLSAPVLYVDVIHAALCNKLGASRTLANLPTAVGAFFGLVPLFVAWLLPQRRWLRPVVATTNLICMAACFLLSAALWLGLGEHLCIGLAIVNGAVLLAAGATFNIFVWEILIRGTTEQDRGKTFSLAYGAGPLFAVLGSELVHRLMRGSSAAFAFPKNFALVFLAAGTVMMVQVLLCLAFKIPAGTAPEARERFADYMLGGFKEFFSNRVLLILAAAFLLYGAGFFAMNNASLNVKSVLGVSPEQLSGRIDALRFGCKALAGFGLGFLLSRFGTRAPSIATSLLLTLAAVWAMVVPGWAYLGAFALFGAGELGGFYYPYYAAAAAPREQIKRTTAIFSITGRLGFIFALVHGYIADHFGMTPSMWLSITAAAAALLLVCLLPARPQQMKQHL